MHIMTKDGWKQLQPKIEKPMPAEPELYDGPLPSEECKAFIKETKDRTRTR